MLRITTHAEGEQTVLTVEGKLVPPWVQELERCWHSVESKTPLVLDIRAVTFVGAEGKELLGQIQRCGAKVLTSGVALKEMLEQLETQSSGKDK
jgi:hypothetical protein